MLFIDRNKMNKDFKRLIRICVKMAIAQYPRLKPICADRAETDLYVFSDICDVMN